jgi:hypothetical protein
MSQLRGDKRYPEQLQILQGEASSAPY